MPLGFSIDEISSPCPEYGCGEGDGRCLPLMSENPMFVCERCGKTVYVPAHLQPPKNRLGNEIAWANLRNRYGYFVEELIGKQWIRHRFCSYTCQRSFHKELVKKQEAEDLAYWAREREKEARIVKEKEEQRLKNLWKRSKARKEN